MYTGIVQTVNDVIIKCKRYTVLMYNDTDRDEKNSGKKKKKNVLS